MVSTGASTEIVGNLWMLKILDKRHDLSFSVAKMRYFKNV